MPLRSWFRWLAKHNHVLFNPASEIELPKATKTLPKDLLTASEAELVMAQPNASDTLGVRDRAILEVFYSTGMRRLELAGLGLYDIDRERGTVHIRQGKGRKDRVVPIGERVMESGLLTPEMSLQMSGKTKIVAVSDISQMPVGPKPDGKPLIFDKYAGPITRYNLGTTPSMTDIRLVNGLALPFTP